MIFDVFSLHRLLPFPVHHAKMGPFIHDEELWYVTSGTREAGEWKGEKVPGGSKKLKNGWEFVLEKVWELALW